MKLNNQIVCFCSSRNTSFLHEEKKKKMEKTKILKRKTQLFYIYLVCMNVYTVHIWHIHTQLNHSTQRSMITKHHYTVYPTNFQYSTTTDSKKETIKVTEIILNKTFVSL